MKFKMLLIDVVFIKFYNNFCLKGIYSSVGKKGEKLRGKNTINIFKEQIDLILAIYTLYFTFKNKKV